MKILVLGGTRFVGRHIVAELLARRHDVTLLYRGRSPSPFIGLARHVISDRRALSASARLVLGESWDAVVDASGHDADDLVEPLAAVGDVGLYALLSTCSVYQRDGTARVITEASPVLRDTSNPGIASAIRKLRCERYLRHHLTRRGTPALTARLGFVIGPHDYTARFAYWLDRATRPGNALVPMDRDQPMQLLDARDAAAFLATAVERGVSGTINVTGDPTFAGEIIDILFGLDTAEARACWVDEHFAISEGLVPWIEVPLWISRRSPERRLMAVDPSHARDVGLRLRPFAQTANDCLAWHGICRSWSQRWLDGLRESCLLEKWTRYAP